METEAKCILLKRSICTAVQDLSRDVEQYIPKFSFALECCFCIAYGLRARLDPKGKCRVGLMDFDPSNYFQFQYVSALFSLLIFIFWFGYWSLHLIAIIYGSRKLHRKVKCNVEADSLPGVSIIKPLVGVDSNLISNLTTFFFLNYPKYEILFCVHDASDSSLPIVQSLVEKYPHVPAKVFIGGTTVGLNPKINNMMPGYVAAQYQLILISDSGLRMKKEALLDMVMAMREDTAVVTQLPFTYDRKGFAAIGWKCAISSLPALQNSGICSVTHFHDRLTRWARLRFAMLPYTVVLEPLQECILLGALTMPAASYIFGWNCAIFFLAHVFCWLFLDCVLLSIVQGYCVTCGQMRLLFAWLYRELSASSVFVRAAWNQTIHWRTATFRLRWGGVAELVQS
ncbi:Ceramide glucosyltransferase [Trichinella pseudospiralis]|uniref:ceramide glucosyltransferase n=1 Tax=Trichinella pseudospiralis TaxID=6337 RepID=A0A0V1IEC0_TRIPS|nr:Ceramide glucosyltransferase [Trichinella pseudospiralis]